MPVILAGLEEGAITRMDDLDLAAFPLAEADALHHVDGIAVAQGLGERSEANNVSCASTSSSSLRHPF